MLEITNKKYRSKHDKHRDWYSTSDCMVVRNIDNKKDDDNSKVTSENQLKDSPWHIQLWTLYVDKKFHIKLMQSCVFLQKVWQKLWEQQGGIESKGVIKMSVKCIVYLNNGILGHGSLVKKRDCCSKPINATNAYVAHDIRFIQSWLRLENMTDSHQSSRPRFCYFC